MCLGLRPPVLPVHWLCP
ncbi:hypothetical protein YPPY99_0141, partial [Yersinia pestis PY-99]